MSDRRSAARAKTALGTTPANHGPPLVAARDPVPKNWLEAKLQLRSLRLPALPSEPTARRGKVTPPPHPARPGAEQDRRSCDCPSTSPQASPWQERQLDTDRLHRQRVLRSDTHSMSHTTSHNVLSPITKTRQPTNMCTRALELNHSRTAPRAKRLVRDDSSSANPTPTKISRVDPVSPPDTCA